MRLIISIICFLLISCGPTRPPHGTGGSTSSSTTGASASSTGVGGGIGGSGGSLMCVYTPEAAPLCPEFEHPCTNPGSAKDEACGYNPDNGLFGAAYCSAACGTCPYCRMQGIQGQVCEMGVEGSCASGLKCVGGTCVWDSSIDGGTCLTCN